MVLKHCSKIRMQLPSILCAALGKLLVRLSKKIVDLYLAAFSEMVENRCCRNKKNFNYPNNLLSSHDDQTGSIAV